MAHPTHPRWSRRLRPRAVRPVLVAALVALASLLSAPPPAAARLLPVGEPRPLGLAPDCGAERPRLAPLPGPRGEVLAAWASVDRIELRRLAGDGGPSLPDVWATGQIETGHPVAVRIATFPDGSFAVVWFDRDAGRILARRGSPDGELGAEVEIAAAGSTRGAGFNGLDIAATTGGRLAIAWADGPLLLLRELDPQGAPDGAAFEVAGLGSITGFDPYFFDPVVIPAGDGAVRVLAVDGGIFLGDYRESGGIWGFRVSPAAGGGPPAVDYFEVGIGGSPAAARAADGGFLVAWAGEAPIPPFPGFPPDPAIYGRAFDADDAPRGEPWRIDGGGATAAGLPAVAALAGGGWAVAWHATPIADELGQPHVFGRATKASGEPRGTPTRLSPASSYGSVEPHLAVGGGGALLAAWRELDNPTVLAPPCNGLLVARPFRATCAPGTLCVGGERFELSLVFSDPRRGIAPQAAEGHELTPDTGYFWFFAPDNVEVVVKVLDGRAVNGHFWVFFGGLTDLGFELLVRDTVTGRQRVFVNPPGTLASRGVIDALLPVVDAARSSAVEARAFTSFALERDAFPGDGLDVPGVAAAAAAAPIAALAPLTPDPPGPCVEPSRPGLCLNGRRFDVEATWESFDGATGVGHGVPLGDDSGYFWFFHPSNVELVVKVLDGRAVNGKFWVFYGALSNVEYTLQVQHVFDFAAASYHNPAGRFASVADLDALVPPEACLCPEVLAPVCGLDGKTYPNLCVATCHEWVGVAHDGPCGAP